MIRFKKSMFGFGANSCIKPTKAETCPNEGNCPIKNGAVIVVVGVAKPRPIGRG